MFGRWTSRASVVREHAGAEQLELALRIELAHADEETILVVTALVGLLGAVAYADGEYSLDEQRHVREELRRIAGITPGGVEAVCASLERHILECSAVQAPRYCRIMRELADRELRVQVLEMLVALAATDKLVTSAETNVLRQLTTALGLTQDDYNAAQGKHKEHLAVLRMG